MKVYFKAEIKTADALVLFFYENEKKLSDFADRINRQMNGILLKTIGQSRFKGKEGQTLLLQGISGVSYNKIVLAGLGKKENLKEQMFIKTFALITKTISAAGVKTAAVIMENVSQPAAFAAAAGFGAILAAYRFDKYKTSLQPEDLPALDTLTFILSASQIAEAEALSVGLQAEAEGIYTARNLISEPANILSPANFVKAAQMELASLGLEIQVMDKTELEKEKLNLISAVGQGAKSEPKMLILKYRGKEDNDTFPLCLVGKGVCFDAGGISLKPAKGMGKMKYDMAGAAAVLGTMKTLALRKAKANVAAIMPLVENMPDGGALRPGDVVACYNGKTVEVDNTDAEGRLILADAIAYAVRNITPKVIIDIATLTGAIVLALGSNYAGIFSNNAELEKALVKAGEKTGEKLWGFPMDKEYADMIKSDIADIKNCGDLPDGGSISAAKFIEYFLKEPKSLDAEKTKTKWAHLDIAGMAWTNSDKPLAPKGPTGFGVRLFNQFIKDAVETRSP